ncbi:MAG TPA: nicotinate-nucleotide adenylyltransferase [Terriglobales bacterium]
MNIGLFGGTFDPIHEGHLALATAARERFQLGRIYFVPANHPPHKLRDPLTAFAHRYAMIALATESEAAFVPSLLEAPADAPAPARAGKSQATPNYTIDTIRTFKRTLRKADRLFFLIGVDAFDEIAQWHEAAALFAECEFIVASRPGYSLADIANALPEPLRPKASVTKPFNKQPANGQLVLPGVHVHMLENVHKNISASAIREAAKAKKSLARLVTPQVAEYIRKMNLYSGR